MNNNMKKIKIFCSYIMIVLFSFIVVTSNISAQELVGARDKEDELCDCNIEQSELKGNCVKYCTGNYEINDFVLILVDWVKAILGLVGALALLMFIFGGFTLLTSAGNQERVTKGKTIMINALLGVVIVFTSYMIIQFTLSALKGVGYNDSSVEKWNEGKLK
jgi:hypothetical protein